MRSIGEALRATDRRIVIDPSVVRGLEYYTGPVYEVELPSRPRARRAARCASARSAAAGATTAWFRVSAASRFRRPASPSACRGCRPRSHDRQARTKPAAGPVLVTVFDRDRIADYQKMVARSRNAGIRAELYLGNPKNNVGQQLKYADRRG